MIAKASLIASAAAASPDECYRCGYDLRTIDNAQPCPECGLLAERSRRVTDELHDTRPQWLRKLAAGVYLLLLAALIAPAQLIAPYYIIRTIYGWYPRTVSSSNWWFAWACAEYAIPDITALFFFVGVRLLTVPEHYAPADQADARLRQALRLLAYVPMAALLLDHLESWLNGLYPGWHMSTFASRVEIAEAIFITLGCLPIPYLLFERLRGLATRARSAHLAEHCRIVGIGASLAIAYAAVAKVVLDHADQWFGNYWTGRSNIAMAILLILSTAAFLFLIWSAYLMIRFALAFHRAARALRQQWRAADRAESVNSAFG